MIVGYTLNKSDSGLEVFGQVIVALSVLLVEKLIADSSTQNKVPKNRTKYLTDRLQNIVFFVWMQVILTIADFKFLRFGDR